MLTIPGSGAAVATAPGPARVSRPCRSWPPARRATTSGTATLSWTASTAGTYPVADYEVYQVGGRLLATQTGTTLDLTGLTIGASYSYYVVAVDTKGNTSLPRRRPPFTVPPPADASCAVKY